MHLKHLNSQLYRTPLLESLRKKIKRTSTIYNEKEHATTNHVRNIKRNHPKTNQLFSTTTHSLGTDEFKNRSSPEVSTKTIKSNGADLNTDKSIKNSKISNRAPKVKASQSTNTSRDIGTVFYAASLINELKDSL